MKKPQTTAIAKRPDPVGAICKAMVPPPKKRDILIATATAIHQKKLAEQAAFDAQHEAERDALMRDAMRLIFRNLKNLQHEEHFGYSYKNGTTNQCVELKVFLPEPLQARLLEFRRKQRPHAPNVEQIARELRQRADTSDATVQALLSDPSIKSKLLTLGESLLNGLTASDKASAIVVE